jgi:hypothetical protein
MGNKCTVSKELIQSEINVFKHSGISEDRIEFEEVYCTPEKKDQDFVHTVRIKSKTATETNPGTE